MANVLIVAYLLIVLAMIAVILLQRSEGGALGIGGGSGGGLVSARGSASLLTRTTAVLAALFMATAISLTVLADLDRTNANILDSAAGGDAGGRTVSDLLEAIEGSGDSQGTVSIPETAPADGPNLAIPSAPDAETGN